MEVDLFYERKSLKNKKGSDLRSEFSELVRSRILKAGSELFAERGYKATTVRQIATRAGTTHTTVYNYYKSKDAVLYAILGEIGSQVSERFERIVEASADEDAFSRWFADYNAFWLANRGIYLAYWEAMFSDPQITATTRRLMDGITAPLAERLVSKGNAGSAVIAARLALWLHNIDCVLMLAHASDREDDAAALDAAASILWPGLRDIARA
jgi:AcrR family transcriptional regulator